MPRDLKGRWVCTDCGETCVTGEYLTAHSPFDADVILTACPHCRGVETLEAACQAEGCKLEWLGHESEKDAEIDRLRAALSEIADMTEGEDGFNPRTMRRLARQTQQREG